MVSKPKWVPAPSFVGARLHGVRLHWREWPPKFAESAYDNGCHDNHNGSLEGKNAKPDENIQRADTIGKYEQEQERAENSSEK